MEPRILSDALLPRWEKVPEGRMRGSRLRVSADMKTRGATVSPPPKPDAAGCPYSTLNVHKNVSPELSSTPSLSVITYAVPALSIARLSTLSTT